MIDVTSVVRVISSLLNIVISPITKLIKQRAAIRQPKIQEINISEEFLQKNLRLLSIVDKDDSVWSRVLGYVVRPEHFSRAYIADWISDVQVSTLLISLARRKIIGESLPQADLDALKRKYEEKSGEHEHFADSYISASLSFLVGTARAEIKDTGTALLVETGFNEVLKNLNKPSVAEQALLSGNVAQHHTQDAKLELEQIILMRGASGMEMVTHIRHLIAAIQPGGQFIAASPPIKVDILNWGIRILAGNDDLLGALEVQKLLNECTNDTSIYATAILDAANGHIDSALKLLSKNPCAESNSVILSILRQRRDQSSALAFYATTETLDANRFTPIGWFNVIALLCEDKKISEAYKLIQLLPIGYADECFLFGYMRAIIIAAMGIAPEWRIRIIEEDFISASSHATDGTDGEKFRATAYNAFSKCKSIAVDNKKYSGDFIVRIDRWLRWLRLLDENTRGSEIERIRLEVADGVDSVKLIQFSEVFKFEIDLQPLQNHLLRAELVGGLDADELNAQVLLFVKQNRFSDLANFIEEKWTILFTTGHKASVVGTLIQAYVNSGDCVKAQRAIEEYGSCLHEQDLPRFRLMIMQCNGEDPLHDAKILFEKSKNSIDLTNLIAGLRSKGRWAELLPFAFEIFKREHTIENAQLYVDCLIDQKNKAKDIVIFLDGCTDLVERSVDLISRKAWANFHLGNVVEAIRLNNMLIAKRHHINDISLDANLAVRTGDWEKLPSILGREWDLRKDLPISFRLYLAMLNFNASPERAMQLIDECVNEAPEDMSVLMQAYRVASAMARDDIAMPLFHRAAKISSRDAGPIKSFNFKETVQIMKESAESLKKKNEDYRKGQIPLHWAARIFNTALTNLLVSTAYKNKQQVDSRYRQPIPICSGGRVALSEGIYANISMDITSIYILSELNLLSRAIGAFSKIYISPRLLEVLREDLDKVQFHQPSRIKFAKPMYELVIKKKFKSIDHNPLAELINETGEEDATMLQAARDNDGIFVHSGPIYQVDSLLEREAVLGSFGSFMVSPTDVANILYREGIITEEQMLKAIQGLSARYCSSMADVNLSDSCPIYLDQAATQYLFEVDLVVPLVQSKHIIFVHSSTIKEWESLLETEPHAEAAQLAIQKIRGTVRKAMDEGRMQFLPEGMSLPGDFSEGNSVIQVADLFGDLSSVDAVCIDDRFLNAQPLIQGSSGSTASLLCSTDILEYMLRRNFLTLQEKSHALHTMRVWCMFTLPLSSEDLLNLLKFLSFNDAGKILESAELRTLREYLSRLHSSNFLCAENDLPYLDKLWIAGVQAIRKTWSETGIPIITRAGRASWILDNVVPDIGLAMRFFKDREKNIENLALKRLRVLLQPINLPEEIQNSYADWVQENIICEYLPTCANIVETVSDEISIWIINKSIEVSNVIEKRNS